MTTRTTGGRTARLPTNDRSTPRPVLRPHAVYFGDTGRAMCADVHCGGQSSLFTGYDLSGHRVERATVADCVEWERVVGERLACECGAVTLSTVAGSDGWPLAMA